MFASLQCRSEVAFEDLVYDFKRRSFVTTLDERAQMISIDGSAGRALTAPDLHAAQPATCLSRLRGGESFTEVMDRPFTPTDADAGNVKVVVRVRKFIKRGQHGTRESLSYD